MSYFNEGETVYINSPVFREEHEGVVTEVWEFEGKTSYDVRVTKSDDSALVGELIFFYEEELTKHDG